MFIRVKDNNETNGFKIYEALIKRKNIETIELIVLPYNRSENIYNVSSDICDGIIVITTKNGKVYKEHFNSYEYLQARFNNLTYLMNNNS